MALSIETLADIDHLIGQWCLNRVPPHLKDQLDNDYEVQGQAVILVEVRPVWRGPPGEKTRRPYVKFRYYKSRNSWQIYWMRASGKWELYEPQPFARDLKHALAIIEADPYGCFFG